MGPLAPEGDGYLRLQGWCSIWFCDRTLASMVANVGVDDSHRDLGNIIDWHLARFTNSQSSLRVVDSQARRLRVHKVRSRRRRSGVVRPFFTGY
jgi:hypothetical protein